MLFETSMVEKNEVSDERIIVRLSRNEDEKMASIRGRLREI
jgi:hypothetical protein